VALGNLALLHGALLAKTLAMTGFSSIHGTLRSARGTAPYLKNKPKTTQKPKPKNQHNPQEVEVLSNPTQLLLNKKRQK
jgi:hypothetical protein